LVVAVFAQRNVVARSGVNNVVSAPAVQRVVLAQPLDQVVAAFLACQRVLLAFVLVANYGVGGGRGILWRFVAIG
jgi:hypothetical protein